MVMEISNLTQALAIWGAITGTIGTIAGIVNLVLRIKQHKGDRPNLLCSTDFSCEHCSGKVNQRQKVVVRSIGRRPVTPDFIRYFIKPTGFWNNLFRRLIWRSGRWIYEADCGNGGQITEGKKEEFKISLPSDLSITRIVGAAVCDQSGKAWKVRWPTPKKLAALVYYESFHYSEESNDDRLCKISGYATSNRFHIFTNWNPTPGNKNSFTGRHFRFSSKKEFQEKLDNLVEIQRPKMLSCEIDEIT